MQGLGLAVMGMGVVFLSLIVLILSIIVMRSVSRAGRGIEGSRSLALPPPRPQEHPEEVPEEVVAAIAVALDLAFQEAVPARRTDVQHSWQDAWQMGPASQGWSTVAGPGDEL